MVVALFPGRGLRAAVQGQAAMRTWLHHHGRLPANR